MRNKILAVVAIIGLLFVGAAGSATADPGDGPYRGGGYFVDNTLGQADIYTGTWDYLLRTNAANSVWTTTLNDNVVTEGKLSSAARAKLNRQDISGLESDGPYPGATELQDGDNSTAKWPADAGAALHRSWVMCPAGKTAIGGGFSRADEGVAAFKNLQVVTSSPVQIKDGKEVYEPITGDADGSFVPNAWLVEGFNNGGPAAPDLIVRPHVVCATIAG